jgi:hypothetical protein
MSLFLFQDIHLTAVSRRSYANKHYVLGSYGSMIKTGSRWLPIKEDEKIGTVFTKMVAVVSASSRQMISAHGQLSGSPKQAKGRQAPSCRVGEFGEFREFGGVGREKCGRFN